MAKNSKPKRSKTSRKAQKAVLSSAIIELPPVLPIEITGVTDDGDLIALPVERWLAGRGKPGTKPPTIFIDAKTLKKIKPSPGTGDRFLVRIQHQHEDRANATIMRAIQKERAKTLCILEVKRGASVARPVDRKARDIYSISKADRGSSVDGDLVWVEAGNRRPSDYRGKKGGVRPGKIIGTAGNMDDPGAYSLIALAAHDIATEFPPEVLEEAEAARAPTKRGRTDLTKAGLITIDPHDAKDHDDAVVARRDDNPANEGGFRIIVAIADVSWFVRPDSALDREALARGNSCYLPDRVVPMLPERLSNDLCSLREDVDRPCLAVEMVLNAQGQMIDHTFMRAMMRSAAKLSYEEAQTLIDGHTIDDRKLPAAIIECVKTLHAAYKCRLKERKKRAPLDLDLSERKILLNEERLVEEVVVRDRFDAHRLIEEFMILANVAAAQVLEKAKIPLIYRVHDTPDPEKLEAVRAYLQTLDYTLVKGGSVRPSHFNQILKIAEQRDEKEMISEVILRTQRQAIYSPENVGHFGLNLARYAHFTSPIRRYADLIVHRALVKACDLGQGGQTKREAENLGTIAQDISDLERRAMLAERESNDRFLSDYLADHVGDRFDARIRGVNRAGLFVMLTQSGADGFIPMRSIDGGYWDLDEDMNRIVDWKKRLVYHLGMPVRVTLIEATPVEGGLIFDLESAPKKLPKGEKRSSKKSTSPRSGYAKRQRRKSR